MAQIKFELDPVTTGPEDAVNVDQPIMALVTMNRQIVEDLLLMAGQSGDATPLKTAVQVLRKADDLYGIDASPKDNADLLKRLGDTLFTIGSRTEDRDAIAQAITAYRSTITIASMLGENTLRREAKSAYQRAMSHQSSTVR